MAVTVQAVAADVATGSGQLVADPISVGMPSASPVSARRRVLIVAPQPFYQDRGTPIAIRQVLEGLSQLGYSVDLLTYPVGADVQISGLRVIRAANPLRIKTVPIGLSLRKVLLDLPLTLELRRRLSRGGYSCVHAVEEAAFPAVLLGHRYRVPVIYDMQSSLPEQLATYPGFRSLAMGHLLTRLEGWLLTRADFVVSSAGLADRVRQLAPSARVREWHYPSIMVPAAEADVTALRQQLAIPPGVPVVLYSGTFESYQGLRELLQAIPLVREQVHGATFVMLGAENGNGSAFRAEAGSLVESGALRIVDRQPRNAVSSYFGMADILVSARSHGGNLPLKIFDYLAAGRPIVATDIPTHRTVLAEDRAVLVPPHARGLADGIVSLLTDSDRAARLASSACAYAAEYMGWSRFVASLGQLYEEAHRHAPVLRG